MSSAPARIPPPAARVLRGVLWMLVFAVLAAGGAGLVSAAWHAPGGPARAELTFAGDSALDARLDAATEEVRRIAADVGTLATEAKRALGEVASTDPTRLREALQRGATAATSIDVATTSLRESLAGLPGDGPIAVMEYSNPRLVRRAAIFAAIDAATSVAVQWRQVTSRSADAAELVSLVATHDQTVLRAASSGVDRRFKDASKVLDEALLAIEQIQQLRVKLIPGSDQTILDEWIDRNTAYDLALKNLYVTLVASKGKITIPVQSARREERLAFEQLPPDRRTIIVIVSEVARGGLTQAVLAIDDASGRIDDALAEPD